MSPAILFDARLVLERPTGIGQYIASLVPNLVEQAPDMHIHLLRSPNPWRGYQVEQWRAPNLAHHVSSVPPMALRQHILLPWLARRLDADVIHYPHFDAPVLTSSVPVVVTLHDAKYVTHPHFFTGLGRFKQAYMRLSFSNALRRAAAVITVSHSTAADMQRLFGVESERLKVIHEAAAPEFRPAGGGAVAEVKRKYGLPRPFILSVGERRPHKNHAGLIRAYAQSRARSSHDLVVIGNRYRDYAEPEETSRRLDLADRVHFLSGIDVAELVAFYTAADLFVLVSFYEGFGLPILEAMACGTPVITSGLTSLAEVAGDAAVLVDPHDDADVVGAISCLISDKQRCRTLMERGLAQAARFTWEDAARETLTVYRSAIDA